DKARIFKEGEAFRTGKPTLSEHVGGGEEAAFIDVVSDEEGRCVCGVHNPNLGIALAVEFNKSQLPWLTNWQHCGPGEYVLGMEPGTHPPVGQSRAREAGTLIMLEPGERRKYEVTIRVHQGDNEIRQFLA